MRSAAILDSLRRERLWDYALIEASGGIYEEERRGLRGDRRGCHFARGSDSFGARAGSVPKNFIIQFGRIRRTSAMPEIEVMQEAAFEARYTVPPVETVHDTPEEIRRKQQRVRELCARPQRHFARASLPAPGSAGGGRRGGRFAEALADGGENERGRDRFLRRAFHGRNGGDSVPGEKGAVAGPARGLLAGRVGDGRRSCASGRRSCRTRWWSPTSTRRRR